MAKYELVMGQMWVEGAVQEDGGGGGRGRWGGAGGQHGAWIIEATNTATNLIVVSMMTCTQWFKSGLGYGRGATRGLRR